MPFVDFAELKTRVSIEQAVQMLGLKMTPAGAQLRGPCPACQSGGDRALVITPEKGLFYCFGAKTGGDCIALTAHIKGIGNKAAADQLAERFGTVLNSTGTVTSTVSKKQATTPPAPTGAQEKPLQPLQYLEATHPKVQELGISPETATVFGAGYASKGVLRGRFAVPIRTSEGTLVAYVGIAVEKEQSPRLVFHNFDPTSVIWNCERVTEGGDLFVCRNPLEAMLAVENGISADTVVAFLTDGVAAVQFEQLSSLMDTKKIERCEMH
jgi:DNA primase